MADEVVVAHDVLQVNNCGIQGWNGGGHCFLSHACEVLSVTSDHELVKIVNIHVGEVCLVGDSIDECLDFGVVHQVGDDAQCVTELRFAVAGIFVQNGLERTLGLCTYGLSIFKIVVTQFTQNIFDARFCTIQLRCNGCV